MRRKPSEGENNRKFANQYSEEIKAMYKQGCKTKEIAEKIGMSYAAVNNFLLENGYKKCKARVRSEENLNLSDVTFAVPRKPSNEKIKDGNKIYIDITLQYAGQ